MNRTGSPDLSEMIDRASEDSDTLDRMKAVKALKALDLRQIIAHDCLQVVESGENPARRATAAQILGYHGAVDRFKELTDRLVCCVDKEPDLLVKKAIAFALAGTEAAVDLLERPEHELVMESLQGMPLSKDAWRKMLLRFFAGADAGIEDAMISRMLQVDDHAQQVISFLMEEAFPEAWGDPAPRVFRLFGSLEQSDLFLAIAAAQEDISRTYRDIWPGILRRERKRTVMEIFAERIEKDGVAQALIQTLVDTVSSDSEFYSDNRRFVFMILGTFEAMEMRQFLDVASGVSEALTGDGASRLAEVLAMGSQRHAELRTPLRELMADWESIQPGLGLKVFHTRIGVGRMV